MYVISNHYFKGEELKISHLWNEGYLFSRPHIIYSVFSVVAANDPIFPSESLASFDIKKTKNSDALGY